MSEKSTGKCKHLNFDANVGVARLEDSGKFVAEIQIKCIECGTPMQFMGVEPGINIDGATVSLDGTELRIGIAPEGVMPSPFQKLHGHKSATFN